MKKVNKLCFSNGSEFSSWVSHNCDHCIKSAKERKDGTFTKSHCKIDEEVGLQYITGEEVSSRTYDTTQKWDCPYKNEHRKRYITKKKDTDKSLNLF